MTESIEKYEEILLKYNKAHEMRKYSHTTSNFYQKPEKITKKLSLQSKFTPFFFKTIFELIWMLNLN